MGRALSQEELSSAAEIAKQLSDPMWRICSGKLYKVLVKGDKDEEDLVLPFIPNRAQRRFIARMWYRNIILKARQLGFTTLICILWLDHALFNKNVRCGVIAHGLEAAEAIFKDKVKFVYDNLPEFIRLAKPLVKDSATELRFKNNSSIRVATSMRSGTIHRLLVSEYGKVCAKFKDKAEEIKRGSLPAVPLNGITVIESTAEGDEGDFYDKTQTALNTEREGIDLTVRDYRLHFFAWHENPENSIEPTGVVIGEREKKYFIQIESKIGKKLKASQMAWWVKTRDTDFSGRDENMWQEHPSTPEEAFQRSKEGNWYSNEMAAVRKSGRIVNIPKLMIPVNTFWDIGNHDGCAIWFHQLVGMEHRFIRYYEEHNESLAHYFKYLQDTGYIWGRHYLPHDAFQEKLSTTNKSVAAMLEDLGLTNIEKVEVISDITTGIQITRKYFPLAFFDKEGCALGLKRLDNYKKKWNTSQGRFTDVPEKGDGNSEGADAFRQWAQAIEDNMVRAPSSPLRKKTRPRNWRTV